MFHRVSDCASRVKKGFTPKQFQRSFSTPTISTLIYVLRKHLNKRLDRSPQINPSPTHTRRRCNEARKSERRFFFVLPHIQIFPHQDIQNNNTTKNIQSPMVKNQKSLGQFFVGNQPKLVSLSQNMINMGKYHLREILNTHLYVKMI